MESPRICPKDGAALAGLPGSETSLFRCPTCLTTYRASATGLDETFWPPPPQFLTDAFLPLWMRTKVTLTDLENSSTGVVDRLERVESQLSELEARTTDAVTRTHLARIRDDIGGVSSSADAALKGTRVLQSQLLNLRTTIEELNLSGLRMDVDSMNAILRKHIKDHRDGAL
jgi:hypothetical protein